jgi:hypothetical protein
MATRKVRTLRMADFLEETRGEITRRLDELKPLVDEYSRLEAAAAALDGVGGRSAGAGGTLTRGSRPGRRPGSGSKAGASTPRRGTGRKPGRAAKRRGGRPKGSGSRAAEALEAVKGQPGITIKELGAKLGTSPNYLYRVMPGLQKEGKAKKKGNGWHAA